MYRDSYQYPAHLVAWRVDGTTGGSVPVIAPVNKPSIIGKLTIVVKRARKLYEAALIGTMDPFVELKIGNLKQRTRARKKGGSTPVWLETVHFDLLGREHVLDLRVLHDGLVGSSEVGVARIPLNWVIQLHGLGRAGEQYWKQFRDARDKKARRHTRRFTAMLPSAPGTAGGVAAVTLPGGQAAPPNVSLAAPAEAGEEAKGSDHVKLETLMAYVQNSSLTPEQKVRRWPLLMFGAHASVLFLLRSENSASDRHQRDEAWFDITRENGRVLAGQVLLGFDFAPVNLSDLFRQANSQPLLAPSSRRVFGVDLLRGVELNDGDVPRVVVECVEYLSQPNSMATIGIFRVSVGNEELSVLQKAFDQDEDVEFTSPHAAANLLKLYFRSLAQPLVPYSHYMPFVELELDDDPVDLGTKLANYRDLVSSLPKINRDVLAYLMGFLHKVSKCVDNRMDANNLAIVIAPNVLRQEGDEHGRRPSVFLRMDASIRVVRTMIEGFATIFDFAVALDYAAGLPQQAAAAAATAAAAAAAASADSAPVDRSSQLPPIAAIAASSGEVVMDASEASVDGKLQSGSVPPSSVENSDLRSANSRRSRAGPGEIPVRRTMSRSVPRERSHRAARLHGSEDESPSTPDSPPPPPPKWDEAEERKALTQFRRKIAVHQRNSLARTADPLAVAAALSEEALAPAPATRSDIDQRERPPPRHRKTVSSDSAQSDGGGAPLKLMWARRK